MIQSTAVRPGDLFVFEEHTFTYMTVPQVNFDIPWDPQIYGTHVETKQYLVVTVGEGRKVGGVYPAETLEELLDTIEEVGTPQGNLWHSSVIAPTVQAVEGKVVSVFYPVSTEVEEYFAYLQACAERQSGKLILQ